MVVVIRCPNPACGRTGNAPPALAGKAVRCPACRTKFKVPDAAPPTDAAQTGSVEAQSTLGSFTSASVSSLGSADAERPSLPAAPSAVPARVGRFEVRALLGTGAFGAVYRAYDPQLDRDVALKVPRAEALDSPQRVARFLREAKAAARLQHPHIVPVYEAGSDGGRHYIAAALIEGRSLSEAAAESPLDFRAAARVVRDLADALAYVHGEGVVHRDVKPANVLLDKRGRPFLTDFGLAHLESNAERVTRLTRLGSVMGTPAYMPPEQAAGHSGTAQPASDQYSLGVILYELLCGRLPFEGPPQIVLFHVMNTEPVPPRQVNAAVPADLEAICLRAMAKRAEDRYPSCQDLVDALDRWLEATRAGAGESSLPALPATAPPAPQTTAPVSPPQGESPLLLWCQRHPGALLGGVAALILTLLGTALLLSLFRAGPETPTAPEVAAPGPGQPQKGGFEGLMERGRRAKKAGQLDQAIEAFSAARDMNPTNPDAARCLEEAQAAQVAQGKSPPDKDVGQKPLEAKAPPDKDVGQKPPDLLPKAKDVEKEPLKGKASPEKDVEKKPLKEKASPEKGPVGADKLDGTWEVSEMAKDGKANPVPLGAGKGSLIFTFTGGKLTMKLNIGDTKVKVEGTYKIDPRQNPKHIDMTLENGKEKVVQGIYSVEGDTLRIGGFDAANDRRPASFDAKGIETMILRRTKS